MWRPLSLITRFAPPRRLDVVLPEEKVGGSEVRIQFNRVSILLDCAGVVTRHVVAESHPRADHEVKRVELECMLRFCKCLVVAAPHGKGFSVPVVRGRGLGSPLQSV